MANNFYKPGEERSVKVNDLFAKIAPRYDLINDLQSFGLHRYWKRRLLELTKLKPGERALDVCCGTGDIAIRLADTGAEVVGLDFSKPMLEVAKRRRSLESGIQNPTFLEGDAPHFFQATFPTRQIAQPVTDRCDCKSCIVEGKILRVAFEKCWILDSRF